MDCACLATAQSRPRKEDVDARAEEINVPPLGSGQGDGFCPNIACLPSENESWSAKVALLRKRRWRRDWTPSERASL
jgi:hypothetical protein